MRGDCGHPGAAFLPQHRNLKRPGTSQHACCSNTQSCCTYDRTLFLQANNAPAKRKWRSSSKARPHACSNTNPGFLAQAAHHQASGVMLTWRAAAHQARPRCCLAALNSLPMRWKDASPSCGPVTNLQGGEEGSGGGMALAACATQPAAAATQPAAAATQSQRTHDAVLGS
jgi:hypothetical protein